MNNAMNGVQENARPYNCIAIIYRQNSNYSKPKINWVSLLENNPSASFVLLHWNEFSIA